MRQGLADLNAASIAQTEQLGVTQQQFTWRVVMRQALILRRVSHKRIATRTFIPHAVATDPDFASRGTCLTQNQLDNSCLARVVIAQKANAFGSANKIYNIYKA